MPLTQAGHIRFVVTSDFHHEDSRCDQWMEALFRQVAKTEGAAFCFGLGDFANSGQRESLQTMARLTELTGMPFYSTPGNHDLDLSPVDGFYAEAFPDRLNYSFMQNGWQFVVVDTTEGSKYEETVIASATLAWLDEKLPTLDPHTPTVLATHFPLASEVEFCPKNADQLWERFESLNMRSVFSGHFHGQTAYWRGEVEQVTNFCLARVRPNHDGSNDKGYWVCDGTPDGKLTRVFVPFPGQ